MAHASCSLCILARGLEASQRFTEGQLSRARAKGFFGRRRQALHLQIILTRDGIEYSSL